MKVLIDSCAAGWRVRERTHVGGWQAEELEANGLSEEASVLGSILSLFGDDIQGFDAHLFGFTSQHLLHLLLLLVYYAFSACDSLAFFLRC